MAFIGEDKENWGQITALINRIDSEKVFLIKDKSVEGFPTTDKCDIINVNCGKTLTELKEDMMSKLKAKIGKEFEVALSIASGNGKEHMALISALLSIPVGIRLVVFTKKGVEVIN